METPTNTEAGNEPQAPWAKGGRIAMAAYLRSVVGRASERLTPTRSPAPLKGGDNQEDDIVVGFKPEETEAASVGGCYTMGSSGTLEDPVETHDDDEPHFSVRIEPTACKPEDTYDMVTTTNRARAAWAYCDVLLQPDEYGLGLMLNVNPAPKALRRKTPTEATVVVVSSFRRLNAEDIGPAEASGQIITGDILWAINGERVKSLEAVAAYLSRHPQIGSFLLRFLRQTQSDMGECNQWNADPEAKTGAVQAPDMLGKADLPPDVAMVIRELVTRNQHLQEQLVASRLKQDEQRIQLDQLHALYAKTQLENWSAFSLPKPFTRRTTATSDTARGATLSSAAARLIGTNAMQYDVEFAVQAEREKLTRQLEQQWEIEKNELKATYDTQLAAMRAAADKKIRMLEHGIKQLLTPREDYIPSESTTPVEVSPHVLALRHRLLHEPSGAVQKDCLLCLLENECAVTCDDNEQDEWRNQVGTILNEYSKLKVTREQLLKDPEADVQLVEVPKDDPTPAKTQDAEIQDTGN